eukprot:5533067-Alexandrium_andersonii.AAC.1
MGSARKPTNAPCADTLATSGCVKAGRAPPKPRALPASLTHDSVQASQCKVHGTEARPVGKRRCHRPTASHLGRP